MVERAEVAGWQRTGRGNAPGPAGAGSPRTTIAHLVYDHRPDVDFDRLLADVTVALEAAGRARVARERSDTALVDLGGARVGLTLTGDSAAVLALSVGTGPEIGDRRLERRQGLLAKLLVRRIAAALPPRETLWREVAEVATAEGLAAAARDVAETAARPGRRARPRHFVDTADVPRLLSQVEATLAARSEPPGRRESPRGWRRGGRPTARIAGAVLAVVLLGCVAWLSVGALPMDLQVWAALAAGLAILLAPRARRAGATVGQPATARAGAPLRGTPREA